MRSQEVVLFGSASIALVVSAILCGGLFCSVPLAGQENNQDHANPTSSWNSNAWLENEGIRAAWFGYKACTEEMVENLVNSDVNAVFLSHGFHDLLNMASARWEDHEIVVSLNERVRDRLLAVTRIASERGIHVFWIANYELEVMKPHLERLGYEKAYVEGPTRYVPAGPKEDAAALDPVFWRGITRAHGELIAHLSLEHPIEGILYDTEHYAGGMMYLQGCGFADVSFKPYLESRQIDQTAMDVPEGTRYEFLKKSGRLDDYFDYLEERAYEQGRFLARRWHDINPSLIFGAWPLLDNWFSRGLLRGMGGATPALGLSGVEYYHGSDQSESMAEYFEVKIPNLKYLPGFYPPYAYSVEQLKYHVAQAIRTGQGYWMLGPQEQHGKPEYQSALRDAYRDESLDWEKDLPRIDLNHRVVEGEGGPQLVVETQKVMSDLDDTPHITLRATESGSALCENQPMKFTSTGMYQFRVPLIRNLTNNRFLKGGYRSGAAYKIDPLPLDYLYEDSDHTKLTDGRAYGMFGTTIAWPESLDEAEVIFDLHRSYRIERVEVSQPGKLEDRVGGPTHLSLEVADVSGEWDSRIPVVSNFKLSGSDFEAPPEIGMTGIDDPRHKRAWLSWRTDPIGDRGRWVKIQLKRYRKRGSLSLGEVVIWGCFEGEIEASITQGQRKIEIGEGKTIRVPPQ